MIDLNDRAIGPAWKSVQVWVLCFPMLMLAGLTYNSSQDKAVGGFLVNGDDGAETILGRIFIAVFLPLTIVLLTKKRHEILSLVAENKWLCLLLGVAATSTIWSQSPLQTVKAALSLLLTTAFAFWLATIASARRQMEIFMIVGAVAGILSVLFVVMWPARGLDSIHEGAWQGIFLSKNHCARMMVFFLTPALHIEGNSPRWRIAQITYIVLACVVIVMSRSITGILLAIGYIVSSATVKLIGKFQRRHAAFLVTSAIALCIPICMMGWRYADQICSILGKDASLSGRTIIWAVLLQSVKKRILLGYGFNAFWTGASGEGFNAVIGILSARGWAATYAHSGYLDVLLQIGIAGLGILLYGLARGLKDGFKCFTSHRASSVDWYIGIIILSITYNIDEVTYLSSRHLTWIMCMLACIGLRRAAIAQHKIRTKGPDKLFRTECIKGVAAHPSVQISTIPELVEI